MATWVDGCKWVGALTAGGGLGQVDKKGLSAKNFLLEARTAQEGGISSRAPAASFLSFEMGRRDLHHDILMVRQPRARSPEAWCCS